MDRKEVDSILRLVEEAQIEVASAQDRLMAIEAMCLRYLSDAGKGDAKPAKPCALTVTQ